MILFLAALLFGGAPPSVSAHGKLLYEAAASGNLARFEAAIKDAEAAVESMPLGDARNRLRRALLVATDLHRILGHDGLYWDEESLPDYYDRLASEYADFERFITPYRVVDKNGAVLYPKQETRAFLLRKLKPVNPGKRST